MVKNSQDRHAVTGLENPIPGRPRRLRSLKSSNRISGMYTRLISCILLIPACSATSSAHDYVKRPDADLISILSFQYLIDIYNALPEQIDDPIGRNYCLTFDYKSKKKPINIPTAIFQKFSNQRNVHQATWCSSNQGRILSIGPVLSLDDDSFKIGTMSRMPSRPGGMNCILNGKKGADSAWVIESCSGGAIYN